jgi:hypothetical protein
MQVIGTFTTSLSGTRPALTTAFAALFDRENRSTDRETQS